MAQTMAEGHAEHHVTRGAARRHPAATGPGRTARIAAAVGLVLGLPLTAIAQDCFEIKSATGTAQPWTITNQRQEALATSNSEFTALRNAMAAVEGTRDTVYATGRFLVRYICDVWQADSTRQILHDISDPTSTSSVVHFVGDRIYWGANFGIVANPNAWDQVEVSADSSEVRYTTVSPFAVEVEPLAAGGFCLVPGARPVLISLTDVFYRTDAKRFGRLLTADPRILPICGQEP